MSAEVEAAWLAYRNQYQREHPWCDPKRIGRQMRKREFIAGYLAAEQAAALRALGAGDEGELERLRAVVASVERFQNDCARMAITAINPDSRQWLTAVSHDLHRRLTQTPNGDLR